MRSRTFKTRYEAPKALGEATWRPNLSLDHSKSGFRYLPGCSWATLGLSWTPLGRLWGCFWRLEVLFGSFSSSGEAKTSKCLNMTTFSTNLLSFRGPKASSTRSKSSREMIQREQWRERGPDSREESDFALGTVCVSWGGGGGGRAELRGQGQWSLTQPTLERKERERDK